MKERMTVSRSRFPLTCLLVLPLACIDQEDIEDPAERDLVDDLAIGIGPAEHQDPDEAEHARHAIDASKELSAEVTWEYPVASIDLPNGNSLDFYASDVDGATGVIEYGEMGTGSVLGSPMFEKATALEIFHAFAPPDSAIPLGLAASDRSDPEAPEGLARPNEDLIAMPRGWASSALSPEADGGNTLTTGPRAILAPSWCDSSTAFSNDFFSPDGTTYTTWWGYVNAVSDHTNQRKAYNWRGGDCITASYVPTYMSWTALNVSCNTTGATTYVTSDDYYAGTWFSWTWTGANRYWDHGRESGVGGGQGHIGNKWKAATCL